MNHTGDIEAALVNVYNIINDVISTFVPLDHRKNCQSACWFNAKIGRLLKVWRHYWSAYRRNRSDFNKNCYCSFVKTVNNAICSSKRQFELNLSDKTCGSAKALFRYTNSKLSIRQHIPLLKTGDGETVTADVDKANVLNQYFASVFTIDDHQLPPFEALTLDILSNINITPELVYAAIFKLRDNKSSGPDHIPSKFICKLADVLCEPLSILFKKSFADGKFPEVWRLANVTPIYKGKGSVSDPKNYCPISLTFVIIKCLEIIIRDALLKFLTDRHLISSHQYGFLKNHSTLTQLLLTVKDWVSIIDKKEISFSEQLLW